MYHYHNGTMRFHNSHYLDIHLNICRAYFQASVDRASHVVRNTPESSYPALSQTSFRAERCHQEWKRSTSWLQERSATNFSGSLFLQMPHVAPFVV